MENSEEGDVDEAGRAPGDLALQQQPSMPISEYATTRQGTTLLPGPIARAVSFATRSTSLALRMGTVIGGYGFEAARVTTMSGLELGRGILETILLQAGKDLSTSSRTDLSRNEAENVLERSLEHLHRTMTSVVFWTSTGFRVTEAAFSVVSDVSQLLVSALDQFFGSTDSSRAIASIITLIRREFQNPATGVQGEKVGVMDLILGLCGLAYLQQRCIKLINEEYRRANVEEVVWDVVVLETGARVDVPDDGLQVARFPMANRVAAESDLTITDAPALPRRPEESSGSGSDSDLEINLKRQILRSLPSQADSVTISTSVSTEKTVTVDIISSQPPSLSPPPGAEIVEERTLRLTGNRDSFSEGSTSTYRVVYRVSQERHDKTTLKPTNMLDGTERLVEIVGDQSENSAKKAEPIEAPPPLPPKPSSTPRSRNPSPSQQPVTSQGVKPNQKRPRLPLTSSSGSSNSAKKQPPSKRPAIETEIAVSSNRKVTGEKKGGLRNAFKRGPALSGLLHKDSVTEKSSVPSRTAMSSPNSRNLQVPHRDSSMVPRRSAPPPPLPARVPHISDDNLSRTSSRASYVSTRDNRRDSIVSQTDILSIHTIDSRPGSPVLTRTEVRSNTHIVKSRSERDVADHAPPSPRNHRRVRSQVYTPSIYTLKTNDSQTSLILSPYQHNRGMFGGQDALTALHQTGLVNGMFPDFHLLRNIARYMRYSSASYGSHFLQVLGISKSMPVSQTSEDTHRELKWFAHHTESDASDILLSSFVDTQGGSDSSGKTNTGVPMVHYISLDHESKAVVLSCRGTLGFEDVLADMTCDYDDLSWRGRRFKVHKGVHASARRLLYGGDGRVLYTLKQALEEFKGYGLVLTGHSLGGAVTALLGVMLSEPAPYGTSFVTSSDSQHSRLLTLGPDIPSEAELMPAHLTLPPGRPIHVYAYGPPATMSSSLRQATRGLITSIVQGHDLVPYLSLGVLHDLQAVSLAFKTDNNAAKSEVRQRIWDALQAGLANKWYNNPGASSIAAKRLADEDDQWAYAALKTLRASMMSDKLLPPGEVFVLETQRVLRRDAYAVGDKGWGVPARRVVLKYIREVETRFREVRFGTSMLTDHNPAKYEDALNRLQAGVMG
jgi:hypothetical protein